MNRYLIILIITLTACEGKLSDEQRKAMREQMELHKIKKVTEVEITEAAYNEGRQILKDLEGVKSDSVALKKKLESFKGKVKFIRPGETNVVELEQQLVDAYLANESGGMQDNVQKVRSNNLETDSLMYTKPELVKLPDGSERLEGIWTIWLSKKELIVGMK